MTTPTSTKENINTLTEFRQAVDTRIFQKRRDTLFETLDALLSGGTFASFAYPSQSERFRRRWPSLYAAVEDGRVDGDAFRQLLIQPTGCSLPPGAAPCGVIMPDWGKTLIARWCS